MGQDVNVVICPGCGRAGRSKTPPHAGATVRCPQCGATFEVPAPGLADTGMGEVGIVPAPASADRRPPNCYRTLRVASWLLLALGALSWAAALLLGVAAQSRSGVDPTRAVACFATGVVLMFAGSLGLVVRDIGLTGRAR